MNSRYGEITWDLEVDEGGRQLGAVVGAGVSVKGGGVEAVEGAAEGAGPAPALQLAEGAEVGPAVVAAREEVAARTVDGNGAALIGGGEGRDGGAPGEAGGFEGVGVHREAGDRRPHRHG